jgi:hypothetical protein
LGATFGVIAVCAAIAPSAALAGAGLGIAPTFPIASAVGNTELPASLTLTNLNTPPESVAGVCNAGDPLPCPAGDPGIILIPSCGAQGGGAACVSADPNVFRTSTAATGAAGTACANMSFVVTPLGDVFGTVRFVPVAGTHIVLQAGEICRIDFTVDVLKVPAIDAVAAIPGAQTLQVADATSSSNVGTKAFARGSSTGITINPPPPPCTPAPNPVPPGGTACAPPPPPPAPVTGSGVPSGNARISGPSGCVPRNFNVNVRGTDITRVTFTLDGRRIKTLTKPNAGRLFRLRVRRTGALRRGTHRIVARTTFTAASGAPARRLRVVFQRCRRAQAPRFTG